MAKNKKNKLPQIKKDLRAFLTEEEGVISKKSVVDTGLVLMLLATFFGSSMRDASAFFHGSSGTHGSWNYGTHTSQAGPHTSSIPGEHCSHGAHGAHGSHDAHASGGWC